MRDTVSQAKGHLALSILTAALLGCSSAHAQQQSSVTIYGILDQYVNYLSSSSGTSVKALEDGGYKKSRFGLRGFEDLGGGYRVRFTLESGLSADTGVAGDTSGRFFDRQSWVGIVTPYGEIRAGRQNSTFLVRGDNMDYTGRALGSIINTFPVSTRYDNDLSYLSPRIGGVMLEAHAALPEAADGSNRQVTYQAFIDYSDDRFKIGYGALRQAPPKNATVDVAVVYQSAYASWKFGDGTVYLAGVRSNNSTSAVPSGFLLNPTGGAPSGGGLISGTSADARRYFNVYQISADYMLTPQLRIGGAWGRIDDTSNSGRDAVGGSVGAFYNISKRTMFYTVVDTLKNGPNGGFRMSGSGTPKTNITSASDIQGQRLRGVHLGVMHTF
ncbi:porin (plasmid) [Diaphorobacter sp. HDW4B]|uniref:porin n=1 Tax=Diaphorobacter sp. HDW4B TaxID=2714925 RepID=UPI00140C9B5E|nr:porin [Diaphorobacter sp. HDW4B]QIL73881.1 porin [Diaphorobacter sp. HDW4B]